MAAAKRLRGISPVVAVLLLILVAIGAAVLIYLWLIGFTGKSTQTPSTLQTQFRIETARIYNETNTGKNATVEIYLRNTGRTSIDLSALKEQNGIAVYIYESYTGDLIYANTTLAGLMDDIPDTNFTLKKNNPIAIYDGNKNGVWEPNELLVIKFAHLKIGKVGNTNAIYLDNVELPCGHYYDIKVVISGQSATIQNVRVACGS